MKKKINPFRISFDIHFSRHNEQFIKFEQSNSYVVTFYYDNTEQGHVLCMKAACLQDNGEAFVYGLSWVCCSCVTVTYRGITVVDVSLSHVIDHFLLS